MFFRKKEEKRGFGVSNIIRFLMSIFILAVLSIGLYQAYKSFSGVDPLTISPKTLAKNFFTSENFFDFINSLLTFSPNSLDKAKDLLSNKNTGINSQSQDFQSQTLKFKFAVLSDSHIDNKNLARALRQIKEEGAKFVIGLGDFSDVGTTDELRSARQEFDIAGLPYYLTSGDHDLWDSRNKNLAPTQNFNEVFGSPYQSFSYDKVRVIIVYNSDNYFGVDPFQLKWLEDELLRAQSDGAGLTFVFLSIPLYHPSSDHVMGKSEPKLKNQATHLISIFKKSGVAEVFTGDTHFFSRYIEPQTGLKMTSVGALTSEKNPQAPRYVFIDIFENGSYNVRDTEIK